ncbi:MAG: hypothetical protein MUO82_00370 [Candidatus Thermoplasmatota archaeon]|nr:hypothetical protein [Candidatus Thermoplasmatota archaeon]
MINIIHIAIENILKYQINILFGVYIYNKKRKIDIINTNLRKKENNIIEILFKKAEGFIDSGKTYNYIYSDIDKKPLFKSIVKDFHKNYVSKYKKSKGVVLILGSNPSKNTDGAILRKTIREKLEKHLKKKYKESKIEICFPEDAEDKPDEVDIDTVKFLMLDTRTKLILGIWSEDAIGIIPEVHCIAENKNTCLKTKIFIEEKLWNKHPYIVSQNKLNIIHQVFNGVYPVNLTDKINISKKVIQIFDGYYKWAVDHDDEWIGDI